MRIIQLAMLMLVLLCTSSILSAQDAVPTPIPETVMGAQAPTPDVIATAQAMIDEAKAVQDSTLGLTNTFMTFIQAFTAIVAIVGLFVGFFGWRQSMKQLESAVAEARGLRDGFQKEVSQASSSLLQVQLGTRQVDMGNYRAAIDIFKEVRDSLNHGSESAVISYFIGDLYLRLNNFDEGIRELKPVKDKLLAAKASYAYAVRARGDREQSALNKEKHYDEACKVFDEIMTEDPDLVDISGESVFGALAGLYKRTGKYAQARRVYELCHSITKHSSYPVNNLAILHFCYGDQLELESGVDARAQALQYFQKSRDKAQYALDLSSSDYWNLFDLLTADVALGEADMNQLEGHIKQIFERNPDRFNLDKLLDGLRALQSAPNPPTHVDEVIERIEQQM